MSSRVDFRISASLLMSKLSEGGGQAEEDFLDRLEVERLRSSTSVKICAKVEKEDKVDSVVLRGAVDHFEAFLL